MPPSFADLGVPSDLVAALGRRSITEPFPIQAVSIPDALAGRDLCGKAPTGSGKTLAFGVAAVARLSKTPAKPRQPEVLVLTPTRELCSQVAAELTTLANVRGKKVATFYGGVGYDRQIKALTRGVDIAVACPGRLADLIQGRHIRLDAVKIVVVDEADRMSDMGFLPDVRRLLDQTPETRQTLLFSATLDGAVDVLVRRYQKDPARHELVGTAEDEANAEHYFWRVESTDRAEMAAQIAVVSGPTIVFCRTRHSADRTARQLIARGVRAVAIHGDRSQSQRERALSSFAAGHAGALVATDVAARGIHVDGVAAVVHFDPPADSKDYVHRSGRTARAGATGIVVSLVTPEKIKAVKQLQHALGFPTGVVNPDLGSLPTGGTDVSRRQPRPARTPVPSTSGPAAGSGRSAAQRRRHRPPVQGRKRQPQRRAS